MNMRQTLMAVVLGIVVDVPFCIAQGMPQSTDQILTQTDVVKVHDGDTITIVYPGELPAIFKRPIGIRLNGLDTPEMHSRCKDPLQRANEERFAREAQVYLEHRIRSADEIVLRNQSPDKFFRIDADVILDGETVNTTLVELGYAIPYKGEAKTDYWCQHAPTAGQ